MIDFNASWIEGRERDIASGSLRAGTVISCGKFTGGRVMVSMSRAERETMMDLEAFGRDSSTGMMKVILMVGWS